MYRTNSRVSSLRSIADALENLARVKLHYGRRRRRRRRRHVVIIEARDRSAIDPNVKDGITLTIFA